MSGLERSSDEKDRLLQALLVEALQHRQRRGHETTLRDLHEVLEASQPVALRIAHRLENEGILKIERNLSDAFASVVTVATPVASRLLYNSKNPHSPTR